ENLLAVAPDFMAQQYLRGMYYVLKSDQDIHKQDPVSDKQPSRKELKAPVPTGRLTVYDKKRSRPDEILPPRAKEDSSHLKQNDQEPLVPISPVQKPDSKPIPTFESEPVSELEPVSDHVPTTLAEQLGKRQEKQKSLLLNSIQDKKKQGGSLLGGKRKAGDSKGSLLEKIKTRK
ncbi:MAG: hypothetical protein HQ517_13110, partial [SAR324 cluster bacterium]|nr:hypothetical protein [SAR324 cluster bacterium]